MPTDICRIKLALLTLLEARVKEQLTLKQQHISKVQCAVRELNACESGSCHSDLPVQLCSIASEIDLSTRDFKLVLSAITEGRRSTRTVPSYVQVGTLVFLRRCDQADLPDKNILIIPGGGGETFRILEDQYCCISPHAPVAKELLGKELLYELRIAQEWSYIYALA